jgi:aminopeptidase N
MWIHEAFATYAEALFIERIYGHETAISYLMKQKTKINNTRPVSSREQKLEDFTDTDMYYKGSWMLHTMRAIVNNDSLWFSTIKNFALSHKRSVVARKQVVHYFSAKTKNNLSPIFAQYLDYSSIPVFQYYTIEEKNQTILKYRWKTPEKNFKMPALVEINGKQLRLKTTTDFQEITIPGKIESIVLRNDLILADFRRVTER